MNLAEAEIAVRDALEELERDPVTIIREAGCKGVRMEAFGCPVTKYLNGKVKGWRVGTGLGWVSVWSAGSTLVHVTMPNGVTQFIRDFDAGKYPDLEAPKKDI